jgi:hypothetical protein
MEFDWLIDSAASGAYFCLIDSPYSTVLMRLEYQFWTNINLSLPLPANLLKKAFPTILFQSLATLLIVLKSFLTRDFNSSEIFLCAYIYVFWIGHLKLKSLGYKPRLIILF